MKKIDDKGNHEEKMVLKCRKQNAFGKTVIGKALQWHIGAEYSTTDYWTTLEKKIWNIKEQDACIS